MAVQFVCIDFVIGNILTGKKKSHKFAASFKFFIMKTKSGISAIKNIDEEIQFYIKQKKEENTALKKLLAALENAKKMQPLKK